MPLVPSPSTGYTDYQTFGNYDSSLLWGIDTFLGTSPVSSPVMNMTKYAALSGFVLCVSNQCLCTINWYGDVGLTELIAARSFTLTQNITSGFSAMIMPNMGAYAQIVCTNIGGVAFAINTLMFGTNRTSPVIWTPQNPVLINQVSQPIAALTGIPLYPPDYFAGPMAVWSNCSSQAIEFTLQQLNFSAAWVDILDFTIAAGATNNTVWVAPPGAWRVLVSNSTAGAANYSISVTPSLTGAT